MRKTIKFICLANAICAIAINHVAAQTNNNSTLNLLVQMERQLLVLETNKTTESIQQLRSFVNTLRNTQPDNRKEQTRIWLKVLVVIDNNLGEVGGNFVWNVTPPPDGDNGVQYPPGVTPETLKNQVARSNYVAAIRANNEGTQKKEFQLKLHSLNERASQSFERYLKSFYTSSESDKKELDEILNQSKLSDSRKQQIHNVALP